jgi:hypothetical protein
MWPLGPQGGPIVAGAAPSPHSDTTLCSDMNPQ